MPERQHKKQLPNTLMLKMRQSSNVVDSHRLSEGKKAKNSLRTSNNTTNKVTPKNNLEIINVSKENAEFNPFQTDDQNKSVD